MTTNLAQDSQPVKDTRPALVIYASKEALAARAREIVRDVDKYYHPQTSLPYPAKYLFALLAIDAITAAVQRDECLCLHCLTRRAGESEWSLYALRAEVLRQRGAPASKIAHKLNESK